MKKLFVAACLFALLVSADYARALTHSANLVAASNQYFSRGDEAALDITGAWTIEAWVKFTSVPSGGLQTVASKYTSGTDRSYNLYVNDTGGGNVAVQIGINGFDYAGSNIAGVTTGVWYRVAASFSGAGQLASFFFDSASSGTIAAVGTAATTPNSTQSGAAPFEIGRSFAADTVDLNGQIVNVKLWAEARTAAQIGADLCATLGATTNLVGEWSLSNVLTDNSGNALTLTNNNVATFTADVPGCLRGTSIGIFDFF